MTGERTGILKFKGQDVTILGHDLKPGDDAPDFNVQSQDWIMQKGLANTKGKVRIIVAVPSIDTEVCDRETRRFNQDASSLSDEIVILVISTDLPFAQKRWCGATGVDRVFVFSDHLTTDFGLKYGCLMKEPRLLRRAVFVVDRKEKIYYASYMSALGVEPDYPEVLAAANAALG